MKLYEIEDRIQNMFINEDGEMVDGVTNEVISIDDFNALEMAKEEKIENVLLLIKNLKAEADAVKVEADKLAKREKSLRNRIESIINFIAPFLEGEKFSTARVKASFRTTPAVVVLNQEALPEEYIRVIPEKREPDKVAIKAAIKAGVPVNGAVLEDHTSMIIR